MKTSVAIALAAAKLAASHATFQSFVLNGQDQGQHTAVRTPSNGNNPIYDVTSTAMICNGGTAASDTLEVAAGSEITLQWHHNDPATTSGDSDEPIAAVRTNLYYIEL
jgi:cellulase